MLWTNNKTENLLLSLLLGIISLILVILFWNYNLLLILLLLLIIFVNISLFDKKKTRIFLALYGGILGPVAETVMILSGAWTYTNPNLYVIPLWLPTLWGIAVLHTYDIQRYLIPSIKELIN